MARDRFWRMLAAAGALGATGCVEGAAAHPTPGTATAALEVAPAVVTQAIEEGGDTVGAPAAATIRFTVASQGNTARYRVREQLVGRDLPNDAIGETQQVTGSITVDESGALVPGQSRFVVGTGAFKSDSDRRDGYVRRRLLQSEQHPTVELVPTAIRGLPARLPAAGSPAGPITFELVGDLTVRGVTRPTTWKVTARQTGDRVTGTASTRFTFDDFGIEPPRVSIVLSVADTIGLEYDFTLVRDGQGG